MRRVPTRFELKGGKFRADLLASENSDDGVFNRFKHAIQAAMNSGRSHYNDLESPVSQAVEERLRAEFGSRWTFQFNNMRRGCTVFWS